MAKTTPTKIPPSIGRPGGGGGPGTGGAGTD
ncbi:hypothetical protein HNQ90_000253 [Algibacter amylolyticus]|nr:hypothetical protein [Algibacter amylolyticus]